MRRQLSTAATLFLFIGVLDHAIAQAPSALKEKGPYGLTREEYLEAKETLAKAVIAEEGWSDRGGHAAVAFVYARKYVGRRLPRTSLTGIIERHCSALRRDRQAVTARSQLLSGLPSTVDAYPARREAWQRTLVHLDRWYQGQVKDPCAPHKPTDFGSATDKPPVGAVLVECVGVDNLYYEIRR